jgi:hypothetical protein
MLSIIPEPFRKVEKYSPPSQLTFDDRTHSPLVNGDGLDGAG